MSKVVDIYYDKKSDTYYRLRETASTVDKQGASADQAKGSEVKDQQAQGYVPQTSAYAQPNPYLAPMMPMMMTPYGMMPMMGMPQMSAPQGGVPIPPAHDDYVQGGGYEDLNRFKQNMVNMTQGNGSDVPIEELMGEWIAPPSAEQGGK